MTLAAIMFGVAGLILSRGFAQGVAQALGVAPDDQVTLVMTTGDGAKNTLDLQVVGVFQSFSRNFDARAVRIPLAAALELMLTEGPNVLVATLHQTDDTDTALDAIRAAIDPSLEARSRRHLSDFYDKTLQLYGRQFDVSQLIILFMVLLPVACCLSPTAST